MDVECMLKFLVFKLTAYLCSTTNHQPPLLIKQNKDVEDFLSQNASLLQAFMLKHCNFLQLYYI